MPCSGRKQAGGGDDDDNIISVFKKVPLIAKPVSYHEDFIITRYLKGISAPTLSWVQHTPLDQLSLPFEIQEVPQMILSFLYLLRIFPENHQEEITLPSRKRRKLWLKSLKSLCCFHVDVPSLTAIGEETHGILSLKLLFPLSIACWIQNSPFSFLD